MLISFLSWGGLEIWLVFVCVVWLGISGESGVGIWDWWAAIDALDGIVLDWVGICICRVHIVVEAFDVFVVRVECLWQCVIESAIKMWGIVC